MPVMPFVYSRGTAVKWLEGVVNSRVSRRPLLAALRLPAGQNDLTDPATAAGAIFAATAPPEMLNHLRRDWFGRPYILPKPTTPPAPISPWWMNWTGDAEQIVRETLIRAIEVARDIPHGGQWPNGSSNGSSIELAWICGPPMFQGFISRRSSGAVSVVFVTPPPAAPPGLLTSYISMWLVNDPTRPEQNLIHTDPPYAENPQTAPPAPFAWVVGHAKTAYTPKPTNADAWDATYDVMGVWISGAGSPVVTVRPSLRDGGMV